MAEQLTAAALKVGAACWVLWAGRWAVGVTKWVVAEACVGGGQAAERAARLWHLS